MRWGQISVRYAIYMGFVGGVYVLIALRLDGGSDAPTGKKSKFPYYAARLPEALAKLILSETSCLEPLLMRVY